MSSTNEPNKKPEASQPEEPLFEAFPQPPGWMPAWEASALNGPARPTKRAPRPKRQPRT